MHKGTSKSERCTDCKGEGVIYLYANVEDGPMVVADYTCAMCDGRGWMTRAAARAAA